MKATFLTLTLAAVMVSAPLASWAISAGVPAEPVESGHYQVAFEWGRYHHYLGHEEYLLRGYLLRLQGSVYPRVQAYVRLGRQGITIRPGGSLGDLKGDIRPSLGAGVRIDVVEFPQWKVKGYLDLGGQTFNSVGTISTSQTVGLYTSEVRFENEYRWRQLQAAWGFRREHPRVSPYAGASASWMGLTVNRKQLTGAETPTESSRLSAGPRMQAFTGVDFRLTSSLRLSCEFGRRWSSPHLTYTMAIAQRTN